MGEQGEPMAREAHGLGARAEGGEETRRLYLAKPRRIGRYERWVKPVLDRIAGIVLSIVTAPVVAVIALLIRTKMGAPVLFRQRRVGLHGREFVVYKFRTMTPDRRRGPSRPVEVERRVTHKSEHDPRHTPLGRVLRRWSLDELPQLWNVAKGEMSLVGPRPELPEIVARYEPWQHRRHEVKPGLTGLWQVSARGDKPMHEATELDIEYVENLSFLTDLKILLATPRAAFGSHKGA